MLDITASVIKKSLGQGAKELDTMKMVAHPMDFSVVRPGILKDYHVPFRLSDTPQALVTAQKGSTVAELRTSLTGAEVHVGNTAAEIRRVLRAEAQLQTSVSTKLTGTVGGVNKALTKASLELKRLRSEYTAGFEKQALRLAEAEKPYKHVQSLRALLRRTQKEWANLATVPGGGNEAGELAIKISRINVALRKAIKDLPKTEKVVDREQAKLRAFLDTNIPKLTRIRELEAELEGSAAGLAAKA